MYLSKKDKSLPNVNNLLDKLASTRYITWMDLKQDYY